LEIFAILIGLVILAAIAYYLSRPLVQARRGSKMESGDALSLEARRESLYTQIKELDLDHATGKVNEEDYARIRAELVAEAAAVLRQIDQASASPAPQPQPRPVATRSAQATDDIEALIAARRKTRSTPAAKTTNADVEAAIAARRKTAVPATELKCPQCGKPISADDAFCAKCGTALRPQVAQ
jgi:hypothetical protein